MALKQITFTDHEIKILRNVVKNRIKALRALLKNYDAGRTLPVNNLTNINEEQFEQYGKEIDVLTFIDLVLAGHMPKKLDPDESQD